VQNEDTNICHYITVSKIFDAHTSQYLHKEAKKLKKKKARTTAVKTQQRGAK